MNYYHHYCQMSMDKKNRKQNISHITMQEKNPLSHYDADSFVGVE